MQVQVPVVASQMPFPEQSFGQVAAQAPSTQEREQHWASLLHFVPADRHCRLASALLVAPSQATPPSSPLNTRRLLATLPHALVSASNSRPSSAYLHEYLRHDPTSEPCSPVDPEVRRR